MVREGDKGISRVKILGIIQARDHSTRLPNKSLERVNGLPIIDHIIRRLVSVKGLDGVVVSTSEESPNIIKWCRGRHSSIPRIACHVGPESDLLTRHIGAATKWDADAILRVTGDELFHDPAYLSPMVAAFYDEGMNLQTDAIINWSSRSPVGRSVSEGLDTAIVSVAAMHRLDADHACPREDWITYMDESVNYHVTCWNYREKRGADIHLSVDTPDDLERARRMVEILGNDNYAYADTLRAYEATK